MFDAKKHGPWAVIAGASEGVGAAFAQKLGRAGLNLVLIARKAEALEALAAEIRASCGVEVRPLPMDLTAPDMLERIRAVTDDVEVGLLVYNAGANQGMDRYLDAPLEAALRVVRLNPVGQVSLTHHFGTKMVARGRGGIVLVGSLAGNAGATPLVAYCASKAFAQALAEGLWSELGPKGVDVVYIVVGAVDTPNRRRQLDPAAAARPDNFDDPNQVVFPPEEIAQAALDNLANGPVHVPGKLQGFYDQLVRLPRPEASKLMKRMLSGFRDVEAVH
jgi:short-subunit dehydrogenase